MPRYIDADALKDVIQQHDYPLADRLNSIDNGMFTLGIFQAIDEQPTLSPDEVRGIGKWKLGGFGSISDATEKWYDKLLQGGFLYCSACKCRSNAKTNYCPNCGAKMEVLKAGKSDA